MSPNKPKAATPPFCLTVAGLDPSGGAGATADLRVFRHLGTFGLSAFTALTPQNTRGVKGVHPVEKEALKQELSCLFEDFPIAAAKTGQIPNRELAKVIIRYFKKHPLPLVVDPVMVPTRGRKIVENDAIEEIKHGLLPLATVLTPNVEEASWLAGMDILSRSDVERAGRKILENQGAAVVVTGWMENGWVMDCLVRRDEIRWYKSRLRPVGDIHGSGCHYSAILCAQLARKIPLPEAVQRTKRILTRWIDKRLIDPTGQMKILFS